MPNERFHVRRLLMLLTLSPLPVMGDDARAARLADQVSSTDSQVLARYCALAYSRAELHDKAKQCAHRLTPRPTNGDPIDALVATIVYGRAGDMAAAEEHFVRAKDAMHRESPIHIVDSGSLVIQLLRQRADAIFSHKAADATRRAGTAD